MIIKLITTNYMIFYFITDELIDYKLKLVSLLILQED
jgi:hypothetical protein